MRRAGTPAAATRAGNSVVRTLLLTAALSAVAATAAIPAQPATAAPIGPSPVTAPVPSTAPATAPATVPATPRWFDAAHRPGQQADEAIRLLADAAVHGLDPADYDAPALLRAISDAAVGPPLAADAVARVETRLTGAVQRYLTDLHRGRIDPRQVHQDFAPVRPMPPQDALGALAGAVAGGRLADVAARAVPTMPGYAALLPILARYRSLVDHPAWRTPLPPLPDRALKPGDPYAGLAQLRERLVALGDLLPDAGLDAPSGEPPTPRYGAALEDAVRAFQQRHGLAIDGVIGRSTLAQLEVRPAQRARQIALTLERLRWTPLLQGPRMIVVNIPEFALRAYEIRDDRIDVQLTMKVIVGKALDTRTPVFDEDMRFIEFSPYWNVPPSIARSETVPRLRRDPGYLERQGFEFVARDGSVSQRVSAAQLDAVLRGDARIRQRPGPLNALGDIKFVFPNNSNIFLHHTPSPQLFAQTRRDFSHGCIRVEDPVGLAAFVLAHEPAWPIGRIRDAMQAGRSSTLRLAEPIPVLIAYATAVPLNGRIHFHDDIYGHDARLDAALRERTAKRLKTEINP